MSSMFVRTGVGAIGLLGSLVALPSAPARACGGAVCSPSVFLPVTGSVPSNAVEFLWRPANAVASPVMPSAQLYKVEQGQRTKLDTTIVEGPGALKRVRPVQPVAPGTVLLLESTEPVCATEAQVAAQVSVSAESPKPSQLGTLRAVETLASTTLRIPTASGSCSDDFLVASVRLALTLAVGAQPFADSLQHALLVDGQKRPQPVPTPPRGEWPSFALTRKLEDVVYALCARPSDGWTNDVSAGSHRVQWLATLPDGTELRSDEITIDLRCASAAGTQSDAGIQADASAAIDAASEPPSNPSAVPAEASASTPDAAASAGSDAALTPASAGAVADYDEGDNASCSLRAAGDGASGWVWLGGLALVLRIGRRRRTAGRCRAESENPEGQA